MPQDTPCRPWRVIADELSAERNLARIVELSKELNRTLQTRTRQALSNSCGLDTTGYTRITGELTDYKQIVDRAVTLMRADYASMQMLHPERGSGGELHLLAFLGFNPQAAQFWEWVRADSKSTCGLALLHKERIIAPDIAGCDFMADSEDQRAYLHTGIHACQTTPLIGRHGNVVGMISTHWRTPHKPSPKDLQWFDALAMRAADLIERSG